METTCIKTFAIVLLLTSFAISAYSQVPTKANAEEKPHNPKKVSKEELPKAVADSFYKQYPVTTNAAWYSFPAYDYQLEWWDNWYDYNPTVPPYSSDYYAADYTHDDTQHKTIYHKNGKRVATHKKLKKEIPKPVLDAIANSIYKTWHLGKEKEEIFKDKNSMKVYKIEVENGTQKHALFYQQDGKLLKDRKIS